MHVRASSIVVIALGIAMAGPRTATAQAASTSSDRDKVITAIAGEIAKEKKTDPRATLTAGETPLFALALQEGSLVRLLQDYEEQRSDEQIGATSSASGTTTLVSKGAVPRVFALAMETIAAIPCGPNSATSGSRSRAERCSRLRRPPTDCRPL